MLVAALLIAAMHQVARSPELWPCAFDQMLEASWDNAPARITERLDSDRPVPIEANFAHWFQGTDGCRPLPDGHVSLASPGGSVAERYRAAVDGDFHAAEAKTRSVATLPGHFSVAAAPLHTSGERRVEGERVDGAPWAARGAESDPAHSERQSEPAPASHPNPSEDSHVTILFGACADEDEATAETLRYALALAPDCMVLLGDTPYIDSTDLDVQRRRYSEFAAFPPFRDLCQGVPLMASTWDDHDYGKNDGTGRLKGKENSRAAFVEARSSAPFKPPYGENGQGIYSSFRKGPCEVFLLDTRWFAQVERSPFDPKQKTLLGKAQWAWLKKGLKESTAPFKVLACGMTWTGHVRGKKRDHWGSYPYEYNELCRFLGAEGITGVVFVGGDLHVPRAFLHETQKTVGYPIVEFVSSPMSSKYRNKLKPAPPGMLYEERATQVLLELSMTESELHAKILTPEKVLFELKRSVSELKPR